MNKIVKMSKKNISNENDHSSKNQGARSNTQKPEEELKPAHILEVCRKYLNLLKPVEEVKLCSSMNMNQLADILRVVLV